MTEGKRKIFARSTVDDSLQQLEASVHDSYRLAAIDVCEAR